MNLNDLRGVLSRKRKKRVGRGYGSGHGKTSGRGHKGQRARSSGNVRPGFEGGQMPLHRRLPIRGFTNIHRSEYSYVNCGSVSAAFEAGSQVTPEALKSKGLVKKVKNGVKVLGAGEVNKPLTVKAHSFSKSAMEKIAAAGGKTEVI